MFVEQEFADNEHTVEGSLLHEAVDEAGGVRRGETLKLRKVYLYSRGLGICGIADVVEEKRGEVYPVEYKKGRRGGWKNDRLQLCAQAMCLEEMLGIRVAKGYIYYAATARRETVDIDEPLRALTRQTIEEVRKLMASRERPEAVYKPRCHGCSLRTTICLPREVEALRSEATL